MEHEATFENGDAGKEPISNDEESISEEVDSSSVPRPHELGIELPDDPDAAIAALLGELAKSRSESTNYLGDLKRVAADFDNYRKRTMRDQTLMLDRAAERVIQKLLPALDSFDAAVNSEVESEAGKKLLSGMLGTREQLLSALSEEGLEVIAADGEKFDPELHEPVGAAVGNGDLYVAKELRRGYRLNGRLVRAALVTVESEES